MFLNQSISMFLPETVLLIFFSLSLILMLTVKKCSYEIVASVGLLGIIATFSALLFGLSAGETNFFTANGFTAFFKTLMLISSFFIFLMSKNFMRLNCHKNFKLLSMIFGALLCAFSLASANDFLIMLVASVGLSLSSFGIICLEKAETLKKSFIVTSSLSHVILAGGIIAFFCNSGGLSNINDAAGFLSTTYPTLATNFSLICIIVGLMFSVGIFTCEKWFAKTIQNSNYTIGAYLSLIPPIAVLAIVIRILGSVGLYCPLLKTPVILISLFTMTQAVAGLIKSTTLRQLLAYSSALHFGFLQVAVCSLYLSNIAAILFYLLTYIIVNIGLWAGGSLFFVSNNQDDITAYKGLFFKRPFYVAALSVSILALAGMPVTSGFLAKLYLFMAMARSGILYLLLLIFTMIISAFSVFAYFKFIGLFYQNNDKPLAKLNESYFLMKSVLYLSTIMTILLNFVSDSIIQLCIVVAYMI